MSYEKAKSILSAVDVLNEIVATAAIEDIAIALQEIAENYKIAEDHEAARLHRADHEILWLSVKRCRRFVELDEYQRVAGDIILSEES